MARACAQTLAFGLVLGAALLGAGELEAQAADAPIVSRAAGQVTADALPTVQINGVVWDQVVNGNTVYAGGQFTSARPAGSAAGTNETARGNLLAYDITTGNLITGFAPALNGVVNVLALSPDKTRLYVGGAFTSANGVTRNRIAAYNTATGQLVASFNPNLDAQVKSIAVTNSTVYVGGIFSRANGTARSRLAAFDLNGNLLGWAPTANAGVNALLVAPDSSKLIVTGAFATLNDASAPGLGALDLNSGAALPFAANKVVQNYGSTAAGLTLKTDGTTIYGVGYWFGGTGNFEGVWAADAATGNVKWLADCHGDTYDAQPMGGAVYSMSHHHNCENIASHPEQNPRVHFRAQAFTADTAGTVRRNRQNNYANFEGYGSPSQINWFPDLKAGTFTGQAQAAWTVEGNADYLVAGGEFPQVNGTNQQGLVRFAVPAKAPRKSANQISSANSAPVPRALAGNAVRVAWPTNWDRDDDQLTYQVRRTDKGATPVHTVTAQSLWWQRKLLTFIDTTVQPNTTYTYQIRENDPDGNVAFSSSVSVTTGSDLLDQSAYAQAVQNDGASNYWRLNDKPGATTAVDWAGGADLNLSAGVVPGATPGALVGSSDTAATIDGTTSGFASTPLPAPGPNVFTAEAWVKTTSAQGGKLVGFGSASTGSSRSYDRHLYLDNTGRVTFGLYTGQFRTLRSALPVNDGQWHQIVGTLAPSGAVLYVDGVKVASDASTTSPQPYDGYWRVGGDNTSGWPNAGTSQYLAGAVDDVAIYPSALTATQVRDHFAKSGRSAAVYTPPTDGYGKTVAGDKPELFWRLDDADGPTARDASENLANGVYSGGVGYRTASPVTGTTGSAASFNGTDATVGSSALVSNPTTYSEELWFTTTTTNGGKLIGFGDRQSGNSGSYDRHVYMDGSGRLTFGTYTGTTNTVTSPAAYNDGKWHHVVATQGAEGMRLYVDGVAVGSNGVANAQTYDGYWRVGGDSSWAASNYFDGAIDEVAVYGYGLSATQVRAHYVASPASVNAKPVAAFTSACTEGACTFDASTSADPDGAVTGYAWDFGDGKTATGVTPAHTFTASGSYEVTLTVTDDRGASASTTTTVAVTVPVQNQLPTAAFAASCTERDCTFDGATSSDPDGSVSSYAWEFGDGATATTVAPRHTFAADGTYPVKLTVTDNRGGSASVTKSVKVANNAAPSASFTTSCTALACDVDASASTDSDGSVASYAWDFGDGAKASTATASHTYAAAGEYSIKLTVTDDAGAQATTSKTVQVAPATNQKPTAAFAASGSGLVASLDGSTSADADGRIVSYAWDFGDATTGSGSLVSHTYAGTGSYAVRLTVTDDRGATASVVKQVLVGNQQLASDAFSRSLTSGWGTAVRGGAWGASPTSRFAVDGAAGRVRLEAPGVGGTATLGAVAATNVNAVADVTVDKTAAGSPTYATFILRKQSTSDYRVKLLFQPNGTVAVATSRVVNGAETSIRQVTVAGLTYAPGDTLRFRATVSGTNSSAITAKVWKSGAAEPVTAQLSATDSTASLQAAGSLAFQGYLGGAATNAPVVVALDNLLVTGS